MPVTTVYELPAAWAFERAVLRGTLTVDRCDDRGGGGLHLYNHTVNGLRSLADRAVVQVARGLVLRHGPVGYEVVALPFPAFRPLKYLGMVCQSAGVEITEKLDGALVISYRVDGEVRFAGRSRFSSLVADLANEMWRGRPTGAPEPPSELTLLCELVCPDTRVLIDSPMAQGLVLVGARNRFTGDDLGHALLCRLARELGIGVVRRVDIKVDEAIGEVSRPRADIEGYVVRLPDGERVKLVNPLYEAVYDLCRHCTPAMIGEVWADGWPLADLGGYLPASVRVHVAAGFRDLDERSLGVGSGCESGSCRPRRTVVRNLCSELGPAAGWPLVRALPDDV